MMQMFFGWIMVRLRQVAGVVEEKRSPAMVNKPMVSVIVIPFRTKPGVNIFFVFKMDKPPVIVGTSILLWIFAHWGVSNSIILNLNSFYKPFFPAGKSYKRWKQSSE